MLLIKSELLKDFPFFGTLGFIFGIVQLVGNSYSSKFDGGTELLLEHIAFKTLVLTVGIVVIMRMIEEVLARKRHRPRLSRLVTHIAGRAVAIANVSATVLLGFATAALVTGYIRPATIFAIAALFFAAISEFAANPILRDGQSQLYFAAITTMVVVPISAHFW
ncbi:hypothetical protein E2K99_22765 [Herbaspirillum huttiense]|uniref:hypothetical protein n=1 Tax=Herbaspirillum huttiense TaxID=863372 RepID=UPI001065669E|nr:hypothetical protein [Herbaspirillum huttiense]QBP77637.1 hypothetical protein E2K99_22765 [Herbaspirillum huttiense]